MKSLTKNLWALRLQKAHGKISYDSETDTEAFSSQAFSSHPEAESTDASGSSRRSQKTIKVKEGTPNLMDTLSLCYIAILLLRMPVTISDLHEWVNEGELLYYRTSRQVPLGMRERLPAQYQGLLEPQDLLSSETLHKNALNMAVMFNRDFGMAIPPLNVPLLLYRWIRTLVLPLEIFAGTQRLVKLLDLDFSSCIASRINKNVVLRYQEAQLIAVVIVATKLLFPFDGIERRPHQPTDLSSMSLDWDVWVKLHQAKNEESENDEPFTFQQGVEFNESDCQSIADGRLDAYLDWYEDTIASEEIREHGRGRQDAEFRRTLFKMFPAPHRQPRARGEVSSTAPKSAWDRLCESQITIQRERIAQPGQIRGVNRMGSFYRRFRTLEDLTGPAKLLFERSACLAAISLESMVQAVFLTEKKLEKIEEGLRKGAKASGND